MKDSTITIDSEQDLSNQALNSDSLNSESRNTPVRDMDSNSRKRKMESEESNDEDVTSVKSHQSEAIKSFCSSEDDIKYTFGLKYEYLKSLGIKPPLEKWVHVSNFRCDKSELKEVLELAGHVILCSMITIRDRYAKVMYSHPLEAVQAVSMLNGQIFYGQRLNVTMIKCPSDTIILPKGLTNIGPGLGMHGRPLRDIVKHYRKYLKNQMTLVDVSLFHNPDDIKDQEGKTEWLHFSDDLSGKVSSSYSIPFKTRNVEDLQDDASVTSESKSKRAKRESDDNSVASDQGSEEALEKQSNTSEEEPKPINTVTTRRNPTPVDADSQTNCDSQTGKDNIRPSFPPGNVPSSQNFPLSLAYNPGPRIPLQPPVRPGICPPPPMIGSGPIIPGGPFGPSNRPIGPPTTMIPSIRPTGLPPGPIRPPPRVLGPPTASTGPPMRHTGPPMRSSGPPMRPTCPVPSSMGPSPGIFGPMNRPPGPYTPRPVAPFQPSAHMSNNSLGPRPVAGGTVPVSAPSPPINLEFRNLPPTTTFPLLCEKVSQCGQVLSLQLTTPGCATARFAHRAHADRCFQFFHGKFIDGCVIEVRYA